MRVSIIPAIAIEIAARTSPTPTLWSWVIPVGIPVNFDNSGMKTPHKVGLGWTWNWGSGHLKPPMFLSILLLCWMENVWTWAKQAFMKTVFSIIGSIQTRIFVSSTCVTVQSFQGFSSLLQHGPKTYKDMMHFFSYESMINSGIYQMILMIILELTSSLKNLSLCSFFIMNFVQHSCCIWDGKIPVSNGRNKYLFKQVVNWISK